MQSRRSLIRIAVLAAVLAAPTTAASAPPIRGIHDCSIIATGVAFGTVVQTSSAQSTGEITLVCTGAGNNNSADIALSTGASGSYASRTMQNGAGRLGYNLYLGPAHTVVWGDGTGGSQTFPVEFDFKTGGTLTARPTVFGLVPAQVTPPTGQYVDLIIVTVSF
jgi:spore coat protein U-like protein